MFEVRFSICPENCWVCSVSERFPEVAIEVLSLNEQVGLGKWSCRDKADLTDAFAFARSQRYVSALERIHYGGNSLVTKAVCRCPFESRVHKLLPKFGYFYLFPKPIWFLNGMKHYRILVPEHSQFPEFIEEMGERFGDIKITYKSPILNIEECNATLAERTLSKLSPRQREALQKAYSNSYYEYPRQITLEKMARDMAIGKSTFQSHLRKAENKIIRSIVESTQ